MNCTVNQVGLIDIRKHSTQHQNTDYSCALMEQPLRAPDGAGTEL